MGSSDKLKVSDDRRGRWGYRAPELLRESGAFSSQSDIWSLGCIMYELFVGHPLFESDFVIREYMAAGTPLRLDDGEYSHHMKPFQQTLHFIPSERPSVYKLKVQLAELNAPFKKDRDREEVSLQTEARTVTQRPSLQVQNMSQSERSHNPAVRVPGATGLNRSSGNQQPNLPTENPAPPVIVAEPLPDDEAASLLTSSSPSDGSERANQRARHQHTRFSRGPRHTPTLDFMTISMPFIPVPAMDGPWDTTSEWASIIDRSSLSEEREPAAAVRPNHDGTENINQRTETSNHVDGKLDNDSSPSSRGLSETIAPIGSRPGSPRINEHNRIPGGLFEGTASSFSLNNNQRVISALVNGLKLKSPRAREVQITSRTTYQAVAISPSCETIALITSEDFLIYSVRKSDRDVIDPQLACRGKKDGSYATALDLSPGGSTRAVNSTDCVSNFEKAALGDQILCIASDKAVTLQCTATGQRVHMMDLGLENTACLGISFDNSTLAMGLATGAVWLRSLADFTSPCSIIPGTGHKVTCLAFSRCSKYLSVCTSRNIIYTYRINTNTAELISIYDCNLAPNRCGEPYLGITGLSL